MSVVKDKKRNKYYISYRAKDANGVYKTHNIRNKDWNITGKDKVTLAYMKNIELEEIEKNKQVKLIYTSDGKKLHLNQLCEMFYEVEKSNGIDKDTITNYKSTFKNYLLGVVGEETLVCMAFKVQNIDKIKINLSNSGIKENSINNKLVAIRKLIDFARKRKFITRATSDDALDLLENVKTIKNEETDNFFVHGEEDLRAFEKTFEEVDQEWYVPIMTMFYGGLRIGEWLAITKEDVDIENCTILINKQIDSHGELKAKTKGRSVRMIRLPRPFVERLNDFICKKESYNNGNYIFSDKRGRSYCRNTVRNIINKHCDLANISHITPHGLRHSIATRMFDKGYSVTEVQEQLGHSSMETTMQYYIHYTQRKGKDIDDLM